MKNGRNSQQLKILSLQLTPLVSIHVKRHQSFGLMNYSATLQPVQIIAIPALIHQKGGHSIQHFKPTHCIRTWLHRTTSLSAIYGSINHSFSLITNSQRDCNYICVQNIPVNTMKWAMVLKAARPEVIFADSSP